MTCCLSAPSHYLHQCWLTTSRVLRHSPEGNNTWNAQEGKSQQRIWKSHIQNQSYIPQGKMSLTHWGRVTHICVSKNSTVGSDNDGLSPGRRQAIIWTNAGIVLIWTLGTNFSEILIKINTFSLKKMHLKMSSGRRQPSCLGLNVLKNM